MASSITLAGESLKAQKQGAHEVLEIRNFVLALVPGLDPNNPIDRSAGLPPAEQIVGTWPYTQKGFVDPNRVVYSLMLGSDVGDFDWNWIGLTTAEGVLFATSTVPVQQKRRNIPPLQTGNNVTRNFMLAFDGAQALTAITVEASTWQHDFTEALAGKLGKFETAAAAWQFPMQDLRSRSDLLGPPSSLWGKGTIIGLANGDELGIPGLVAGDHGVLELHGHWSSAAGHAAAAQRIFRGPNGRQFYQHQLPGVDQWSAWFETFHNGNLPTTSSPTDKTPGRLLRAGDGGWMGDVPTYIADLDDRTIRGFGYASHTHTANASSMPFAYAQVLTFGNTGDQIHQEAWEVAPPVEGEPTRTGRRAWRSTYGNKPWGAWDELISTKNIHQFAPSLAGGGATGTWGISVYGSAQWATEAGYTASAGHAETAGAAVWAGGAELAGRLTLHGGDHCSFSWNDQGDSPMYLLGIPGGNPAEGRIFATQNLNVATARRAGTLNWTAYSGQGVGDGNHLIFDASGGLSPSGTAIGSVDSQFAWQVGSPTLMGWNGGQTYGVRVDRARVAETALVADSATYAATAGALSNNIVINGIPVNAGSNVTIGAIPVETRTWQDVSGQRAFGVNYTNDAPVTITLAVSFADNGSKGVSVIVNGEVFGTSDIGANSYPFFIDVPPGHVYQVNGNGNWLEYWKEFRP